MFESAELGHKIDDASYKKRAAKLRADLLDAQYAVLEAARFPVVVLINGVDGAGKGETVNLLAEWMDPRHIRSVAFGGSTEDERARPHMWRFWRALPPKGRIGVLFGSWYTFPIVERVAKKMSSSELDQDIEEIVRFERMLTQEGALLLKFWFHLSKEAQRRRLRALERDRLTRWRVTKTDWRNFAKYDAYRKVSERVLRLTSQGDAPWTVVEGTDSNFRSLTVGQTLLDALHRRLEDTKATQKSRPAAPGPEATSVDELHMLRALKFEKRLSKEKFGGLLEKEQARLNKLSRTPAMKRHAVVVVFEGNDAAGKGGAIRRITGALDARQYQVIPVAAPTEEERAQPYLWRFWRHVPPRNMFTVFDRSWYGRVLVERVEGFCDRHAWGRAYSEINDFEEQLVAHGIVVVKLWLAITQDEQLRRFKDREKTRFKRFKITADDWRNREKWGAYEHAACDMIDQTSTDIAPWTLVEANDKHLARITVLRTISSALERAL